MTTDQDRLREFEFDRAARALHAQAVDHVPLRTLQQLRARRGIATRAPARAPRALGWAIATACVAVLAVAIGLRFDRDVTSTPADMQVTTTADPFATDTASVDGGYDDALASYDEDPGLYLWLASSDAQPLAME